MGAKYVTRAIFPKSSLFSIYIRETRFLHFDIMISSELNQLEKPNFKLVWTALRSVGLQRQNTWTLVAKIQPDKVVRWCADGEFSAIFCVLYFQPAACGTFQTYIPNLH